MQCCGSGRDQYLLVERFGIAAFSLALVADRDSLRLVPRRWSLAGIPMPHALLPNGVSREIVEDGRFCFDVDIALPWIGRIVAYKGTLTPG